MLNLIKYFDKTYLLYAELPYRFSYPESYKIRLKQVELNNNLENIKTNFTKNKMNIIKQYNSQITYVNNTSIIDEEVVKNLIVEEKVWKVLT